MVPPLSWHYFQTYYARDIISRQTCRAILFSDETFHYHADALLTLTLFRHYYGGRIISPSLFSCRCHLRRCRYCKIFHDTMQHAIFIWWWDCFRFIAISMMKHFSHRLITFQTLNITYDFEILRHEFFSAIFTQVVKETFADIFFIIISMPFHIITQIITCRLFRNTPSLSFIISFLSFSSLWHYGFSLRAELLRRKTCIFSRGETADETLMPTFITYWWHWNTATPNISEYLHYHFRWHCDALMLLSPITLYAALITITTFRHFAADVLMPIDDFH